MTFEVMVKLSSFDISQYAWIEEMHESTTTSPHSQTSAQLPVNIPSHSMPPSTHKHRIQFKDNKGSWSSAEALSPL